MNLAESAALALSARERGWQEAESADQADLILINTCSVRATAEQRVRGRLDHHSSIKKKRPFCLVLAGCMAQRLGTTLLSDYPAIDYLLGTTGRSQFPLILEALERGVSFTASDEEPVFSFSPVHADEASPYRSFVPIMHGCSNYCSYCIVPYVRGPEISRDPAEILQEIRLVGDRGIREITLLGQNVNSYLWKGPEGTLDFPGLLRRIASQITDSGGVQWVRFLSSHPKDVSDELIRVLSEHSCFCRHIHLCVQHGSNRILEKMNRRYSREHYLDLVRKIRSELPQVSLSTDLLVGFPGETEEDFQELLSLMEEVKFLYAYMYHYNPREGTAAWALPDRIADKIKKDRLQRVISLQKVHTTSILRSRVGQEVRVLIEGISRKNADELISRTERDEMVVVRGPSSALGSFATLNLSSLRGNTFRAEHFEFAPNNVE